MLIQQATLRAFLNNFRWIALGITLCGPLVVLAKKAVRRCGAGAAEPEWVVSKHGEPLPEG